MDLRLTVVLDRTLELAVSCEPGTPWGQVVHALTRSTDLVDLVDLVALADAGWHVGAQPLPVESALGVPPLLDGVVVSRRRAHPLTSAAAGLLHLHVTSGPDAGSVFPLGSGAHRLGRAAEAALRVEDPDLSRLHLEILVSARGTSVCDLSTTNGSQLAGTRLGPQHRSWRPGERLLVGSSVLELRTHGSASATTVLDGDGHLQLNRRPRLDAPDPDPEIRFPEVPVDQPVPRLPLVAVALPLLVALPLAWLQRSPTYLLFGLISPAMLLGGAVAERRGGRRRVREEWATWQRDTTTSQVRLDAALVAEGERRRAEQPDLAELLVTAEQRWERIWERSPGDRDALVVRIGLADQAARTRRVGPEPDPDDGPLTVPDVPASVDLGAVGVLGVSGPATRATALARAVVAQLCGWHSPRDVRVVILAADESAARAWTWATWLPHCRPDQPGRPHADLGWPADGAQVRHRLAELGQLLADRRAGPTTRPDRAWPGPAVVVVLDGARRIRSVPGVASLLAEGPACGIALICLDRSRADLPTECRAIVELDPTGPDGAMALLRRPAEPPLVVVPDLAGDLWVNRFARAMAPLRDPTPVDAGLGLPGRCHLLTVLGIDAVDPAALAETWAGQRAGSMRVPIGVATDGPYAVDLRTDGPHVLIGGTTGAGKSELLQTLITSLAVANSPTQLQVVLIDYKGGAAFDECARLPHTVGLVTDLDPQLGRRALISLNAELRRREAVLRAAGAKDLDAYAASRGPTDQPLARLVIVIDEFRLIAEDLPDFLAGMVTIAAVGRSLGVHLVLATQRPAGIVTADIAANVNLRIALRVRDVADSEDVINAPDAAAISTHEPGRAFARSAASPLVAFQAARVAGSSDSEDSAGCRVQVLTASSLGDPPVRAGAAGAADPASQTDLARITDAAVEAARRIALPPPRRPWLPPLPELVTLDQLDAGGRPWLAPYAVADRPGQQDQVSVGWDLATDTHLAVVGTMRSGRSTALRTLAGSLASRLTPDQVHLHAVDGGAGALLALARLPHAGVVCGSDDIARGVRLVERLEEEVARRREWFGRAGWASLLEHHDSTDPGHRLPFLVLLIDGWEAVSSIWETVDHGRPVDRLHQLMRDGPTVGLRVVIAGDRGLLASRLASWVSDKLILRMADPMDLVLAGIPTSAMPVQLPPGRGLRADDQTELQVALLDVDASGAGQIAALDRIAARPLGPQAGVRPLRIDPLPAVVAVEEAGLRLSGEQPPGWGLVGIGGDDGRPVGLTLRGTSALVAGPPGSGRSTALATLARWLSQDGAPVIGVTAGPSKLTELTGRPGVLGVVDAGQARLLADLLEPGPDCCVVVDDVERLLDTEAEDVVLQWLKRTAGGGGSLVVAGSGAELGSMFRGLSVVARRSCQGVLLQPSAPGDGDLLGVRISATDLGARLPGRGVLVHDRRSEPVQVAR